MREFLLALLTIGGFGIAGPAFSQTATQYPFCVQGVGNPGWSGCSFSTYQQCQASASGTEAECVSNPWYKPDNNAVSAPAGSSYGTSGPIGYGTVSSASNSPVGQYPFCIQGFDNPGWSGCSFNTLQECQASAAGTESECLSNPWYRGQ
jgi:hypothetical protein